MKLSDIKRNPSNPRIIKDEKFQKLVNSIKEFPKMMSLRPMVIDGNNVVLGGNMRLKALNELGYKEIPDEWVKQASELTEAEQRRFIIADNVGFGEHDWELLSNEWDVKELADWGLDVINWAAGVDANNLSDEDIDIDDEFDPIGISKGLHKIVFIFNNELEAETFMSTNHKNIEFKKFNGIYQINLSDKYGQ